MVNTRKKTYGESDGSDTPDATSSTSKRSSRVVSNQASSSNTPLRRSRRISTSSVESSCSEVPGPSVTKKTDKKITNTLLNENLELTSSDNSQIIKDDSQNGKGSRRSSTGTPIRRSRRLSNSSIDSLSNDQATVKCAVELEKLESLEEFKSTPSKKKKVTKPIPKEELVTIIEENPDPDALSENSSQLTKKEIPSMNADLGKACGNHLTSEIDGTVSPSALVPDVPLGEVDAIITTNNRTDSSKEPCSNVEQEKQLCLTDMKENEVICNKEDNAERNQLEKDTANKQTELINSYESVTTPLKAITDTEKVVSVKGTLPKSKPAKQGLLNTSVKSLPCGANILQNIPRGKPKSGRQWKDPKSNPRYMYQDKGLKMPFKKIQQLREELKRVKEIENRLKEDKRLRLEDLRRRQELNKKKREENERKGEIVQEIRNSNKIKRMKKKQLRLVQKRDTTIVG